MVLRGIYSVHLVAYVFEFRKIVHVFIDEVYQHFLQHFSIETGGRRGHRVFVIAGKLSGTLQYNNNIYDTVRLIRGNDSQSGFRRNKHKCSARCEKILRRFFNIILFGKKIFLCFKCENIIYFITLSMFNVRKL